MKKEVIVADKSWAGVYKVAAIAAFAIAVLIPIQGAIFVTWPIPETVQGWFALFRQNRLPGLLDMDLLLIVDYVLSLLVFLGLWIELKRTSLSLATIALFLQAAGLSAYFSSMAAFEMAALSDGYYAAATETEKTLFLAAGQGMLSTWQGTAFNVSYVLGFFASLTNAIVMLKSNTFSKTTAWFGIAAAILMAVPPTAGMFGMVLAFLSLVPTIPWLILVGRRFRQLGRR